MRTSVGSWLAAAAVFSASAYCRAEEPPKVFPECTREPTENDTAAAKGAFEAGQVSFQEADYARAIMYWEDAFRRDCTAVALLLNLARAYELSDDKKNAVGALKTYLARKPNAADKDQITRRIEVLEAQMAREEAARPPAATASANNGAAPPEGTEPAPVAEGSSPREPATQDKGASSFEPLWPLFVAGGGLAVGVVGAVIWAGGASDLSDATANGDPRDKCPGGRCETDEETAAANEADDAESKRNAGIVVTAIGGAALIGGGVAWFLLRGQDQESTVVAPSVAPGFAGLQLAGRF